MKQHNKVIDNDTINNNLKIIRNKRDIKDLYILESLFIKQRKSLINVQTDNFDTVIKFLNKSL